jgi:tRNA(fMet)-specific endonuclease VapC
LTILLDTNACIATISGRPPRVRERFWRTEAKGESRLVSSITLFELWYGVARSARVADNTKQLALFLTSVEIINFDEEDARTAGSIEAELRGRGTPIGPYDLLIAAQAVRRNLLLITANVREFARVSTLRWEDWTTAT